MGSDMLNDAVTGYTRTKECAVLEDVGGMMGGGVWVRKMWVV